VGKEPGIDLEEHDAGANQTTFCLVAVNHFDDEPPESRSADRPPSPDRVDPCPVQVGGALGRTERELVARSKAYRNDELTCPVLVRDPECARREWLGRENGDVERSWYPAPERRVIRDRSAIRDSNDLTATHYAVVVPLRQHVPGHTCVVTGSIELDAPVIREWDCQPLELEDLPLVNDVASRPAAVLELRVGDPRCPTRVIDDEAHRHRPDALAGLGGNGTGEAPPGQRARSHRMTTGSPKGAQPTRSRDAHPGA